MSSGSNSFSAPPDLPEGFGETFTSRFVDAHERLGHCRVPASGPQLDGSVRHGALDLP